MKFCNSFDALAEDVEAEVLVRRVDGVALQPEAHQDGLDAENPLEIADDGDASSPAYRQRLLAERFGEPLFRRLIGRVGDGADVAFAAVHRSYFHLDAFGSDALDIVDEQARNRFVVLMRHQAARHLGIRFRGQHRLRAFAGIASPDAADVERGAAAVPL